MRLFVALALPAAVREALAATQARLQRDAHPVRWSDITKLHLTLQFLGETDAAVVAPLLAGLARLEVAPLRLTLSGLGAFPGLQQPRVIWAGVAGDIDALGQLQAAVVELTRTLGFAVEPRSFVPHLTLGRVRSEARPAQLRALAATLRAAEPPPPLGWQAGQPILYQSTLTPHGPSYTALGPVTSDG